MSDFLTFPEFENDSNAPLSAYVVGYDPSAPIDKERKYTISSISKSISANHDIASIKSDILAVSAIAVAHTDVSGLCAAVATKADISLSNVTNVQVLSVGTLSANFLYGDGSNLTGIAGGGGGSSTYNAVITAGDGTGVRFATQTFWQVPTVSAVGTNSIDFNTATLIDSTVSAVQAIAMGTGNAATGTNATAIGAQNVAAGIRSSAIGGLQNKATGLTSTTIGGDNNIARGNYSIAAGRQSEANHDYSFVHGFKVMSAQANTAHFENVSARGFLYGDGSNITNLVVSVAGTGSESVTLGTNSSSAGQRAMGIGYDADADHYQSTAIGVRAQSDYGNHTQIRNASNTSINYAQWYYGSSGNVTNNVVPLADAGGATCTMNPSISTSFSKFVWGKFKVGYRGYNVGGAAVVAYLVGEVPFMLGRDGSTYATTIAHVGTLQVQLTGGSTNSFAISAIYDNDSRQLKPLITVSNAAGGSILHMCNIQAEYYTANF